MHLQLATLAQASVLQLRAALRRVTVLHEQPVATGPAAPAPTPAPRADARCNDWQETSFDVRHTHHA